MPSVGIVRNSWRFIENHTKSGDKVPGERVTAGDGKGSGIEHHLLVYVKMKNSVKLVVVRRGQRDAVAPNKCSCNNNAKKRKDDAFSFTLGRWGFKYPFHCDFEKIYIFFYNILAVLIQSCFFYLKVPLREFKNFVPRTKHSPGPSLLHCLWNHTPCGMPLFLSSGSTTFMVSSSG